MQDIPAETKKRGPSSQVLQEVIHQAPAEYVTVGWLTSTLHRHSFGIIMLCLGLLATTPVGSTVPGLILAVIAVQLIVGRTEPVFPHFIMTRRLPTKQLLRLGGRAIHVLKYLEKVVHPRWPMAFEVAKRAVGVMVLLLTVVLLLTPVPLSNIAPAMVISLISCLCRGRRIVAFCCVSCRDYSNRHWVSSSLGNNCRRSPYQRLVVTGQPDYDTFGGSLCTSSGHSSSTSSRISSETSERLSVSSRNLCSRSKSSCTMIWSEIIRGAKIRFDFTFSVLPLFVLFSWRTNHLSSSASDLPAACAVRHWPCILVSRGNE